MPGRLVWGVLLVLCLAWHTLGCDVGAPALDAGLGTPPLHVLAVSVTKSYDERGRPVHQVLTEGTISDGVQRTASLTLTFDRFLLPEKIIRQAICLRPSTAPVDKLADCGKPSQQFLEPVYSPARRQVTYLPRVGERLLAHTLYRLTVFVPNAESDYGFRAFDGQPLARKYQFDFRTAGPEELGRQEPVVGPERYCAAQHCVAQCRLGPLDQQPDCIAECDCLDDDCTGDGKLTDPQTGLFATSCVAAGCHGTTGAMGLELHSEVALAQTAIGKVAHQTQMGEKSESADLSPDRFGRAMPIMAPGNPGNSYALYKLIINPGQPVGLPPAELATELQRLRDAFVVGLPMPPADPNGEQSLARLLLIESWIAHGAVVSCHQP